MGEPAGRERAEMQAFAGCSDGWAENGLTGAVLSGVRGCGGVEVAAIPTRTGGTG